MSESTFRARILEKIEVDTVTGCWVWTAAKNAYGYGVVGVPGERRTMLAHRAAYELFAGQIPDGLDLDHLCRTRHCVRPEHLEPVTRRINLLRGETATARHAAKTHCPQGHPYDGPNLIIPSRGGRKCRACDLVRKKAARDAKRSKGARNEGDGYLNGAP